MKEWNNDELTNYISRFGDTSREAVLKNILESELLNKFLSATEGRLLLDNVVDRISSNLIGIIGEATGDSPDPDKIIQLSMKLKVAYDFMYSLAKIAEQGKQHIEKMKK